MVPQQVIKLVVVIQAVLIDDELHVGATVILQDGGQPFVPVFLIVGPAAAQSSSRAPGPSRRPPVALLAGHAGYTNS